MVDLLLNTGGDHGITRFLCGRVRLFGSTGIVFIGKKVAISVGTGSLARGLGLEIMHVSRAGMRDIFQDVTQGP